MKKTLFILQSNTINGAEIVLKNYLNEIDDKIKLFLFTNDTVNDFYTDVLYTSNIYAKESMKRIFFSKNPFNYFLFVFYTFKNIFAIHKIIKTNDIEIIYGNNSIDCVTMVMYKMLLNKRVKLIAHLHDMFDGKSLIGSFIKLFAKRIDQILVPSNATNHSVKKLIGDGCEIETVYNGINVSKNGTFKANSVDDNFGLPRNKKIVTFIGAIQHRKRPDLFLSIVEELLHLRRDFFAVMVGNTIDRQLERELKERINSRNLPVKFIGKVEYDEMRFVYEITDYLILTSDKDPLPTVILECMSHGKIAVARDVDGVSEMIENKKNGYLFSYNEPAVNIAGLISEVFNLSETEKEKIRTNALDTINSKFSNKTKKEKISSILNSL